MVTTDGLDVTVVVSGIGVLTDVYTFVVPGSVCVIGAIDVVASAVDIVVPLEATVVVFRTEGFVIAVVVWVSPVTTPDVVSGVTVVTSGAEVVVSTMALVEVVSTGLAVVPFVVVDGT